VKISLTPNNGTLESQLEVEDDNDKLKSKTMKEGLLDFDACKMHT
jgi:hypothetical protein